MKSCEQVKLLQFGVITILQVLLDKDLANTCETKEGKIIMILHHMLSVYIIFGGFIFNNYKLHLTIIVISFIIHFVMKICPITKLSNKLCNINEDTRMITLLNHITGIYSYDSDIPSLDIRTYYYPLLILIIMYDLHYINPKMYTR